MDKTTQYLWPQIGNETVANFLESSLRHQKIAQTYLFTGPSHLGKFTMALAFAANLQGNPQGFNSDLHILERAEGQKNISIEDTRSFIKTLNLSSFLNSYKIGIIKDADLLSLSAKSALLKTLEEPQEKVVIIILANDESKLPETILSRSQILYFYPVSSEIIYDYLIANYQVNRSLARDLANLVLGRPLLAVKLLDQPAEYKAYLEKAELWLSLATLNSADRLLSLDQIFKDKTWSKQAVTSVQEILFMAEGLARDLLLLNWDKSELIQHSSLLPALNKTLNFFKEKNGEESGEIIIKELKTIVQARQYLEANINPRLVLEQVIINL